MFKKKKYVVICTEKLKIISVVVPFYFYWINYHVDAERTWIEFQFGGFIHNSDSLQISILRAFFPLQSRLCLLCCSARFNSLDAFHYLCVWVKHAFCINLFKYSNWSVGNTTQLHYKYINYIILHTQHAEKCDMLVLQP